MPKHPGRSPIVPRETTRFSFAHLAVGSVDRTGRPRDAPLRRVINLSQQSCTNNGKTGESQGRKRVFRHVLHKWHSRFRLGSQVQTVTLAMAPACNNSSTLTISSGSFITRREARFRGLHSVIARRA